MVFGLTQQWSTTTVKNASGFIALCLEIFIWKLSARIENNRVVVVSAFYETKQTAEGLASFTKNDQQVNR